MAPATSERIELFKKARSVLQSLNKETSPKDPAVTETFFADVEEELSELCQEALEAPVLQKRDDWKELCDCVRQSIKLFATLQEQAKVCTFDLAALKTPVNINQVRRAHLTLNLITHLIDDDKNKVKPSMDAVEREHLVYELREAVNLLKSLHYILAD